VVAVPVCDENFGDFGSWITCKIHLSLRAFAAVNENILAFVFEKVSGDVPVFGWYHAARTKEYEFHRVHEMTL
jgi:hypothetical protein